MSKLPQENKFLDLSDYGRPIARLIAQALKNTRFTPIDVTISFVIAGLLAIISIIYENYWIAGFFLVLKSILDAADGELARIKNTPSYTGRFLDSICDIVLNFILLMVITQVSETSFYLGILAFICLQLQGTLYNYYYAILREKLLEFHFQKYDLLYHHLIERGEKQRNVTFMYQLYRLLYGGFDKFIYTFDPLVSNQKTNPNWLMTFLSIFGLGFQLLLIGFLLIAGLKIYVSLILIGLTALLPIIIMVRRLRLN